MFVFDLGEFNDPWAYIWNHFKTLLVKLKNAWWSSSKARLLWNPGYQQKKERCCILKWHPSKLSHNSCNCHIGITNCHTNVLGWIWPQLPVQSREKGSALSSSAQIIFPSICSRFLTNWTANNWNANSGSWCLVRSLKGPMQSNNNMTAISQKRLVRNQPLLLNTSFRLDQSNFLKRCRYTKSMPILMQRMVEQ